MKIQKNSLRKLRQNCFMIPHNGYLHAPIISFYCPYIPCFRVKLLSIEKAKRSKAILVALKTN